MTDVINRKNRKRSAANKVILPIFTQIRTGLPSMKFLKNGLVQDEPPFEGDIQINLL